VLSEHNGSLHPKVLFVGEAPGRRGADKTRIPFSGDQSGNRFNELLATTGLTRQDVFITNAVLCCPEVNDRNMPPRHSEIRNCTSFLERTIDLLEPPVVATLGAVALRALGRLIGHQYPLIQTAGTMIELDRFILVPLCHPSPRVINTIRPLDQQKRDFATLGEAVETSGRVWA
jgi:DNA polymerase